VWLPPLPTDPCGSPSWAIWSVGDSGRRVEKSCRGRGGDEGVEGSAGALSHRSQLVSLVRCLVQIFLKKKQLFF
jgi:hypothetical protein